MRGTVAGTVFLVGLCVPAEARGAEWWALSRENVRVWTGLSAGPDSLYAYAGGSYSLAGEGEGVLLRLGLGSGEYETDEADSIAVPLYEADLMVGYRLHRWSGAFTAYAGLAYAEHHNPKPGAELSGSAMGLKLQIEAYQPIGDVGYLALFANASSAFDTFHAHARAAYRWNDSLVFGPEAAILGCGDFDEARGGLSIGYRFRETTEFGLSGGYGFALDDGEGGFYAGVNVYSGL
jgi:hypothetical protein